MASKDETQRLDHGYAATGAAGSTAPIDRRTVENQVIMMTKLDGVPLVKAELKKRIAGEWRIQRNHLRLGRRLQVSSTNM